MNRFIVALLALVLCSGIPSGPTLAQSRAGAQEQASLPAEVDGRRAVVLKLALELERSYLAPDPAKRYGEVLRNNVHEGAYDNLAAPGDLGRRVTADLQAVHADSHLKFAPKDDFARRQPPVPGAARSSRPEGPPGLEEARMIGRVAYLRFNMFRDDPAAVQEVRSFLVAHADAQAIILDSRPNRGGGMAIVNAILPLLYSQRTTVAVLETRAAKASAGFHDASLIEVPAPKEFHRVAHVVTPASGDQRLQSVPLFYLTSSRTGSAAEYLAFALQHTHRALVVGDRTVGAAHFGSVVPIGDDYAAFIPIGRAFDPATGRDWEGVGIAPDVDVPADDALRVALEMIESGKVRAAQ